LSKDHVNLSPKIGQQRHGIQVTVRSHDLQPMAMILRLAPALFADRMGIIKSDQTFAIRSMKCERVIETVWFIGRYWHAGHYESDPMPACWIDHEYLAVQVQKRIKSLVARRAHSPRLSHTDNQRKMSSETGRHRQP
jgi:hypothetical protein